jgi:UDP-glucuronate 4-epimerase
MVMYGMILFSKFGIGESMVKQYKQLLFILLYMSFFSSPAQLKVIVTGGAGFIGSHLVEALLDRGDHVVVIDNLSDYYDVRIKQANIAQLERNQNAANLSVYYESICNADKLDTIFAQEQPDVVCHLAAQAGVRFSIEQPECYVQTNIAGTLNLIQMAHKYKVKHFVAASSSSVYGNKAKGPFKEDAVTDFPCSPYAATKKAAELLLSTYYHLYKINCTCLRFFTVYGPRGRPDMAPFKFLDEIYHDRTITQYGDGTSLRDFTYVGDIVQALLLIIDKPQGFQIFNIGRGQPVKLNDFIQTIERVVGKKAIIKIEPMPLGDVLLTHADVTKLSEHIHYQPSVSLEEGIQSMYDWYRETYLPWVSRTHH